MFYFKWKGLQAPASEEILTIAGNFMETTFMETTPETCAGL